MTKTWKKWRGLVNSCVNFARQIREIYNELPY